MILQLLFKACIFDCAYEVIAEEVIDQSTKMGMFPASSCLPLCSSVLQVPGQLQQHMVIWIKDDTEMVLH